MDRRVSLLALAVAASVFVACGGGGSDSSSTKADRQDSGAPTTDTRATSTTTRDSTTSRKTIRAYFEGFETGTVESTQAMLDNSVPGSIAHTYALHQHALAQALRDAGQAAPPQTATFAPDSVTLCTRAPDGSESCNTFTDFESDSSTGKLTSFRAGGQDLAPRLVLGNGQAAQLQGATVTLVSAYNSVQSSALIVVFEVTAGDQPVMPLVYDATYVGTDGRQSQAGGAVFPFSELQPGSTATVAAMFPGAAPGGRVQVYLDIGHFRRGPVELTVA